MESVPQHPTQESEEIVFEIIDRKAPEIMKALASAPVLKKQGRVQARLAVEGERIVTTLASGIQETINTAKKNEWVVTNPSGEQYIIGKEKFFDRYEQNDEGDGYTVRGYCRAVKNPYGKPIEIMASWGSPQAGNENCMIADACDANGNNMRDEPYLIEDKAFAETYAPSNK